MLATGTAEGQSNAEDADGAIRWYSLASEEKHPEEFEPHLREHPEDEVRRSAALAWYGWKEKNLDKLRYHYEKPARHLTSAFYAISVRRPTGFP